MNPSINQGKNAESDHFVAFCIIKSAEGQTLLSKEDQQIDINILAEEIALALFGAGFTQILINAVRSPLSYLEVVIGDYEPSMASIDTTALVRKVIAALQAA